MATYLDKIIERKKKDLAVQMSKVPLEQIKARAKAAPPPLNFAKAIAPGKLRIIAEVKKASPSKGVMAAKFDPIAIAKVYAQSGASAISVLTEEPNFRGKLDYLVDIKKALGTQCPPLMRKDFILEPYQVYEARAYQADALLLIVACLTDAKLKELLKLTNELKMAALVEVHTEQEAKRAVAAGAKIIGINNRNLQTFETDLRTTRLVMPFVPNDCITVTESGIKTVGDIKMMWGRGVGAILVGEALMTAGDPGLKLKEFLAAGG
jgi:indole-3-glycerol phosphate synthase